MRGNGWPEQRTLCIKKIVREIKNQTLPRLTKSVQTSSLMG